ncbi:MAG: hypothetical protein QS721_01575 [Candidatus Endonucleobacter sp. (ex Gigantidas childressi)]|nr:hypothetical protein [Candidatus Endonucleobacter sp. (ex Gigantidas childressi)]
MRGWLLVLILLAGCQRNLHSLYSDGLPGTASWYIETFTNLSSDKDAAPILERILVSHLRSMGVDRPLMYRRIARTRSKYEEKDQHDFEPYKGAGFTVGGEVNEWQANNDDTPIISFSVYVLDSRTGKKIWSSHSSKKGEPGVALYDLCEMMIASMFSSLQVNGKQR